MFPEYLPLQSADGAQLNLDALYRIVPACFTEMKGADGKVRRVVNFDVLRQLLGDPAAKPRVLSARPCALSPKTASTGTPPKTSTSRVTTSKCSNFCKKRIWAKSK